MVRNTHGSVSTELDFHSLSPNNFPYFECKLLSHLQKSGAINISLPINAALTAALNIQSWKHYYGNERFKGDFLMTEISSEPIWTSIFFFG